MVSAYTTAKNAAVAAIAAAEEATGSKDDAIEDLADMDELKKSVLQKAFTGQLTMDNGQLRMDNGKLRMDN